MNKSALKWGFLFTFYQVLFCLFLAPSHPVEELRPFPPGWNSALTDSLSQSAPVLGKIAKRYLRLNEWDSYHFFSIAKNGYHMPDHPLTGEDLHGYQVEFSFFPAFPLSARFLSMLTQIPLEIALPLTAQFFAAIFWMFLYLLLSEQTEFSESTVVRVMLAFAVLPGSFYLVSAYSESITLASIAGLILFTLRWVRSGKVSHWIIAALFGFLISSSRLVGVTVLMFPLLIALRRDVPAIKKTGSLGLAASVLSGTIAYFIFCHFRAGHWDIYFRLAPLGWYISPSYLGVLNPWVYIPRFFFEDALISLNRFLTLLCLVVIVLCGRRRSWKEHLPWIGSAAALFYLTAAGKINSDLDGMIRYTLPIFFLLWVPLFLQIKFQKYRIWFAVAILISLAIQVGNASLYLRGRWVS